MKKVLFSLFILFFSCFGITGTVHITEIINNTDQELYVECYYPKDRLKIKLIEVKSLKTGDIEKISKQKYDWRITLSKRTRNKVQLYLPFVDKRPVCDRRKKDHFIGANVTFGPLSRTDKPGPFLVVRQINDAIEQHFRLSPSGNNRRLEKVQSEATYTLAITQLKKCSIEGLFTPKSFWRGQKPRVPDDSFQVILKRNNGGEEPELKVLEQQLSKYKQLCLEELALKKQISMQNQKKNEEVRLQKAREHEELEKKKRQEEIAKKQEKVNSILSDQEKKLVILRKRLEIVSQDSLAEEANSNTRGQQAKVLQKSDEDIKNKGVSSSEDAPRANIEQHEGSVFITKWHKGFVASPQILAQNQTLRNRAKKMPIWVSVKFNEYVDPLTFKKFFQALKRLSSKVIRWSVHGKVSGQYVIVVENSMTREELQVLLNQASSSI